MLNNGLMKSCIRPGEIETRMARFSSAHYSAIISTIALIASGGSFYVAKLSYDLSSARDQRETKDKVPAIDIQIRPLGASAASLVISIINRADVNISPLDLTVEHSFEAGVLYLSSAQQSLDKLKSSLKLDAMGTIAPKGVGTLKATLAGATDGKSDSLTPGLELAFTARVRFGDQQDTVEEIPVLRRILAPLTDRLQPTPDMLITAIREAEKSRKNQRVYFVAKILVAFAAFFALSFYLFNRWRARARIGSGPIA